MNTTVDITKKVVKCVLVLDGAVLAILAAASLYSRDVLLGLVLGSIFSIINFRLLAISVENAMEMDPGRAQIYAGTRYMVRLLITAVVLILALKAPYINFIATVGGLLLSKLAALYIGIRSRHQSLD